MNNADVVFLRVFRFRLQRRCPVTSPRTSERPVSSRQKTTNAFRYLYKKSKATQTLENIPIFLMSPLDLALCPFSFVRSHQKWMAR